MKNCLRVFLLGGISLLLCGSAWATIVINEVDYDQPSTDAAEFVELYNNGSVAVDLSAYTLELVNGSGGVGVVYQTFPLSAVNLAPGDFFVICANAGTTPNCDLDVSPDTNLIQNGAPDAVALYFDRGGAAELLVDSISYEGDLAGFVEGTGAPADGSTPYQGLSRLPDGVDTNDNSVDFSVRCSTPGEANAQQATDCLDPVPATESSWGSMKSMYR